jgi:hypothetical protein
MTDQILSYEEVVEQALHLTPVEKAQLLEKLASTLKEELADEQKKPMKSLYGLWADLKVDISAEDIDQIRREMWSNFPREDI